GVPTEAASLRTAYDLLSTVVGELSEAGEPVRDSEVKREMLRRDQGFDEAEYGFRKFSRFLRQAHDEEVVDLTTDDNGNYHLGPAGSTSAKAPSSDGAGRAPSGAPAKKKRERKPEPSRPERQPESRAQEAPQPEPQPTSKPQAAPESKPQAAPETKDSDGDEPSASDRESEEPAEKRPARRGVGRFGRRSRSSTGGDDGGGLPGPVGAVGPVDDGSSGSADSPGPSESGAGARTRSDATTRTGSGTKSSGGRKGLGRYRRGSRKGGSGGKGPSLPDVGPVGGSEPGDDAGRDGATEDEAPEGGRDPGTGPAARAPGGDVSAGADGTSENRGGDRGGDRVAAMDGPSGEVAEHMIRNYAGVGRKTAEKLLEEFGEDVFRVIDEQPERLSRVLPQHRAQAVVEAREAEREQRAT
ncbi:MAG: OST-HTH/LOTUS domain-containing protein, partial [Gemmatimonadota bacterium]